MKKSIALLLSLLLIAALFAGCGGDKPAPAPEASPETTPEAAPAAELTPAPLVGPFDADGSLIFDKDGLKITTAGLDSDPGTMEETPIIWIDVENTGSQDAYLGIADSSINGVMGEVRLVSFPDEDEDYYGGNYNFELTIPAGSSERYALGYYKQGDPHIDLDTLAELEFSFTLAKDDSSWPDYYSEPIVVKTGETAAPIDITKLGTLAFENDELQIVVGGQDYDNWYGPYFFIYVKNKSDKHIGVMADTAELNGVLCDYIYYGQTIAPGKLASGAMSFTGEASELRSVENLKLNFGYATADRSGDLDPDAVTMIDTVTAEYPPQIWGDFTNGGLSLSIKPRLYELLTVEAPQNDPDGVLFTVTETASREASDFDGSGWLYSIGKVSADKLHEMLCGDMSGAESIAKDNDGNYYMYYHPTDVRYARATPEEMQRDADQWSMLCDWADSVRYDFCSDNDLEYVSYDNSDVAMYIARAAWDASANATLSTTEFGPVAIAGVDGSEYAEFLLQAYFDYAEDGLEAPDGEYVALSFPDEELRLDFFFADPSIVRVVLGDTERLYQAVWYDDNVSYAEVMRGWYYAACEKAGMKSPDTSLDKFVGDWHDPIAGRGWVSIEKSLAPGLANISISWPDSASVCHYWELVASLDEEGDLRYENGYWKVVEYDEDGESWINDENYEQIGYFYLSDAGELTWHDNTKDDGGESTFVK